MSTHAMIDLETLGTQPDCVILTLGGIKFNPYNKDDARAFVQNRIGSRKLAEKDLGFKYKYSLEDGLLKLIEWRKKE